MGGVQHNARSVHLKRFHGCCEGFAKKTGDKSNKSSGGKPQARLTHAAQAILDGQHDDDDECSDLEDTSMVDEEEQTATEDE